MKMRWRSRRVGGGAPAGWLRGGFGLQAGSRGFILSPLGVPSGNASMTLPKTLLLMCQRDLSDLVFALPFLGFCASHLAITLFACAQFSSGSQLVYSSGQFFHWTK